MTVVIHDWGSAMGFQYARENPSELNLFLSWKQ